MDNSVPNLFGSFFESLEPRVLFDAVPDATFVLPVAEADAGLSAQFETIQNADSESPRELILVDAGVEDSQQLISEILQGKSDSILEIRIIDSNTDGVQQITQILEDTDYQYDAIHIVSHGDEGEVNLGNTTLSNESLSRYTDRLSKWADALTDDADLLFYGLSLIHISEPTRPY